ncbi:MAG: bacteriophage abortive infection AbiH family protein [Bacilli bacterium]|nr:bacteriophage abortive infection AbiH family protein [Bacilli bacterium]
MFFIPNSTANQQKIIDYSDDIENGVGVLIVGNGYDIGSGYKTRYSDFYEFLEFIHLGKDIKSNLDFLSKYIITLDDFKDISDAYNRNNFFINYIFNNKSVYGNWCDFETALLKIAKTFDYVLSSLDAKNFGSQKDYKFRIINPNDLDDTLFSEENRKLLSNYILYASDDFSSGSLIDKKVSPPFTYSNLRANITKIKKEICNILISDLKEFKNLFTKYIQAITKKEPPTKIIFEIGAILSYNYTSTPEMSCSFNDDSYNFHGLVKNNNIVLGIDSKVDFKVRELFAFKKIFQRSNVLNNFKLDDYISSYTSACYYGISFDKNDEDTLSYMLNKFEKNYIYCLNEDEKNKIMSNINEIVDDFLDGSMNGKYIFLMVKKA